VEHSRRESRFRHPLTLFGFSVTAFWATGHKFAQ
jgi:hypothetical protein